MKQLTLFEFASTQTIKTVHDTYWDEITKPEYSVREQVSSETLNTDTVREQKLIAQGEVAPEHTHWIEEYWVKRYGKKHYYYRYCWMSGRKINRCHLGSLRSPQGREKKQAVEDAIRDGQTPIEIKQMLRGQAK